MSVRVTKYFIEVLRTSADSPGTLVSATTTVNLAGAGLVHTPSVPVSASSIASFNYRGVNGGDFREFAALTLLLSGNPGVRNTSLYVSASTSLGMALGSIPNHTYLPSASSTFRITGSGSVSIAAGPSQRAVSATTTVNLAPATVLHANLNRLVSAATTFVLADLGQATVYGLLRASGLTTVGLSGSASSNRAARVAASTAFAMAGPASGPRWVPTSASTGFNLLATSARNNLWSGAATGGLTLTATAQAAKGHPGVVATLSLDGLADSRVVLPPGGGVPGGHVSAFSTGLSVRLGASLSGSYPASYAETPSGLILIANGVDPMVRWDASSGTADTAGVVPPRTPIALGGFGVGTIIGQRTAFVRFLDRDGNPSNLSPVSNSVDLGRDQLLDSVSRGAGGVATIVSAGHGLATGDQVVIEGITGVGFPAINGTRTITVIDEDTFTVNGLVLTATNLWKGGGRWAWGVASVAYQNVPVPAEAKVARRQLIRNLAGDASTYYVDIDTTDLASDVFTSTSDDQSLAGGEPVALFFDDDLPAANRHAPPPSHKAVVCSHLGRIFAGSDVTIDDGHVEVAFASDQVQGVGTHWPASLSGRMLSIVGAGASYEIASVDAINQVLTLLAPYGDSSDAFGEYTIRPAPAERRLVYFTEPNLPESWPEWDAISLPEDSDEVVGLMEMASFLYILERRHIYKFTFQSDPGGDGFLFRTTSRGCLNDRCWALVEDRAYMLDEVGIHAFDGQTAQAISTPIQNIFRQGESAGLQVNWDADQRFWHAAHDPTREMIRWFVAMTGQEYPRHAICYNYRINRWWIEEYQSAITASTVATIGYRRSLVGSEARRIFCLNEGTTDGVDPAQAIRGTVSSTGPITLTDATNPFPTNLGGAPVAIAEGQAAGQVREIISSSSDTLTIDRPWDIQPAAGDVYQVGGVSWTWQSGWFRFIDDEADNPRDVELVYQPLKAPASVNLNLFYNHGDTPRGWSYSRSDDGITTTVGSPDINVDLTTRTGYAMQRMEGHKDYYAGGDRHVSVSMSGVQAAELVRVYSVTINGVKS